MMHGTTNIKSYIQLRSCIKSLSLTSVAKSEVWPRQKIHSAGVDERFGEDLSGEKALKVGTMT